MTKITISIIASVVALLIASCGGAQASGLQRDLDNDPRLQQAGIQARVTEYRDGFVTVTITKHNFNHRVRSAIASGQTIADIDFLVSTDVAPLLQAEAVLMRRPEVKAVVWKIE